ncbi:hypothetical protein J1605_010236 [Eschrichtius robustus]|uniref:Uncharacterized protein n=1 Tax=Eschrichtius robustus TaxID=9764 RepID=A0AB34GTE5_ESCRO|nr:hypothetical protein J1605_010236 [Eschrichtius robustus]
MGGQEREKGEATFQRTVLLAQWGQKPDYWAQGGTQRRGSRRPETTSRTSRPAPSTPPACTGRGAPSPHPARVSAPAPGAVPGTRGASGGHVGAAPPGGAAASRSHPPSAGDAAIVLPPEPGEAEARRRPGPAPTGCPPRSRAPPSSWSWRRRRRCGPRGRGGKGSGAGVGPEAPKAGGVGGGAAGILRGAAGGRRPCCPGAPLAREPGECELRSPPAAASPRAVRPATPGAARVAAAPQLRAPGRWLR